MMDDRRNAAKVRVTGWSLVLLATLGAQVFSACGDDNAVENQVNVNPAPEPTPEAPAPAMEPEDTPTPVAEPIPVLEPETPPFMPACSLEDDLAPNQTPEGAFETGTDYDEEGFYVCGDTSDWFRFDAQAGQRILVFADFPPRFGDLDLYLYREGQTGDRDLAVAESESQNQQEFINTVLPETATYFVELASFQGSENSYRMFIKLGCNLDSDCPDGRSCFLRGQYCNGIEVPECGNNDGLEPNESASTATPLTFADNVATLEGVEICPEDLDYYALTVPDGAEVRIELDHANNQNVDVFLYNSDGVSVGTRADREGGETLTASFLPAGDYIMLADQVRDDSATQYAVSVTVTEGSCETAADCRGIGGREFCVDSGACEGIAGDGDIELGEACDDDGDCDGDSDGCYEGAAGSGDNICTVACDGDEDCGAFGEGSYCFIVDRPTNFGVCRKGCSEDLDCSQATFCDTETGRCSSRACGVDEECTREDELCLWGDGFQQRGLCLPMEEAAVMDCGVGEAPDVAENGSSSSGELLELTENAGFFENLGLCNEDEDWYVLELTNTSSNVTVDIAFEGNADLDVYIVGMDGREYGSGTSPDGNPEQALGTYLPAGRYAVRVNQFPGEDTDEAVTYSMSVNVGESDCRTLEGSCSGTEPLRLVCDEETGACAGLEGNGEVALGESCDTVDDCVEGASICWTRDGGGDGRNLCTHFCTSGGACSDVPGTECAARLGRRDVGVCVPSQEGN